MPSKYRSVYISTETGFDDILNPDEHVLFECNRYREERVRWKGVIKRKDGMHID